MSSPRWKPSVTVAAVIEQDGRFLLVEEETPEGIRLNQPAGHLDPGESLQEAVVREVLEETACVFTPTALLGVYMSRFIRSARHEDVTYLRFTYAGTVGPRDPSRALDDGILRTVWMTPGEIRAAADRHRSPALQRNVDDWLAGVRHPLDTVFVDPGLYDPVEKS
ncbi:NUDIX hydrolase [uncultured Methylibium sp.]|uniref:NUDIX hydrolase n=1 Tax=uncultured Methylibium sp. TaxID=381093 RepID=UPI0025FDD464|nr:NUDIX hydrolase [uncultured Methylibium sp.]